MKRVEMVKYLHKLISAYDECSITMADEILEGLEHMGMLPPTSCYQGYDVPRWEDEDEAQ